MVRVDPDGFESRRYHYLVPEGCPKCKAFYSLNEMNELAATIREMVDEQDAEYQEHRTGKRQRTA